MYQFFCLTKLSHNDTLVNHGKFKFYNTHFKVNWQVTIFYLYSTCYPPKLHTYVFIWIPNFKSICMVLLYWASCLSPNQSYCRLIINMLKSKIKFL